MCTIMTFDNDTFQANKDAILERIKQDGVNNDDGWNLIIAGQKDTDVIFLQVLKPEMINALLTANQNMVRFWLHARRSTTGVDGISGCHGFRSYTGWFVQHNGILSSGRAKSLPVDSMVISELLEYMTPNHVAEWLMAKETYANVFMINPQLGTYHVVRCTSGSLHTDNKGNFSTNAIPGVCSSEVPRDFHSTNTFPVIKDVPVSTVNSWHSYSSATRRWDWETHDWEKPAQEKKQVAVVASPNTTVVGTGNAVAKATTVESDDDLEWEQLTAEDVMSVINALNYQEVYTLFYAQGWDAIGVPKDILNAAGKKQRGWLNRMQKFSSNRALTKTAGGGKQ